MNERDGLAIAGLSVRYPGRREPTVADLDLRVEPGGLVGATGRTGAGTSTLALTAAGFVPRVVRAHVAGSVKIDGIEAPGASAGDLAGRVGIVFSTPANQLSASKLTVREELAFGLENLGVPRAEMDDRISATLERLAVGHLADREPFSLSGGEQQRVAIASIVVMGAGLLVVDEPTGQLDPAGTRAVADLLVAEAAAGRAVLAVEQDPVVLGRTERCLVLDRGRPVAFDPPGAALGSAVMEPLGLRAPTILRLAALAGVPPEQAFDEAAVAAALGARAVEGIATLPVDARSDEPAAPVVQTPAGDVAAISISDLTYTYPSGTDALRGIDLTIEPGETVAIVGQNGSGKTTLAKHLDGLLRPSTGRVTVGGLDLADRPVHEIARTVGYVFQDPGDQLFGRSVEREVAFGPRNLRLTAAEVGERVERALAITDLAEVRGDNPYDLGLSVRKLVALAGVLAMDPSVLVLDEPTTGQDGPGVARIGGIIDAWAASGRTMIAITHDMEFAAAHFGRIVVMRGGQVVADGPPAAVFAPETAAVLDSTGLEPPLAARIGARLGLGSTPTEAALHAALARRPSA